MKAIYDQQGSQICLNKGINQTVTTNVHITLARMLRLLHNPITTQLATPFNKSKYYMNPVSPHVQDTPTTLSQKRS